MSAETQPLRRLVERDVAIAADADDAEVEPAGASKRAVEAAGLLPRVARSAVQHVHARRLQVHVAEQMCPHERMKAAWIAGV